MPTKREREYYRMGFRDGMKSGYDIDVMPDGPELRASTRISKPKRKLSAWNKFVKNKRNHITYRDGKLNLKKMAVAFRRKQRR
jgi:hypothetical protein